MLFQSIAHEQFRFDTTSYQFLTVRYDVIKKIKSALTELFSGSDKAFTIQTQTKSSDHHYSLTLSQSYYDRLIKMDAEQSGAFSDNRFFIKNLSGHEHCYFRDFLAGITRGANAPKEPAKRKGRKKRFTVKGSGVEDRETRQPQYTPREKAAFSKAQSVTYISTDIQPDLFVFSTDKSEAQVAFIFNLTRDVLTTKRNFTIDRGTVSRPFDFDTRNDAEAYFKGRCKHADAVLFEGLEAFEHALLQPTHPGTYSETLARLKWTEGFSAIAISRDSDHARWMALGYADRLKQKLHERAKSHWSWLPASYAVPITHYLKGTPLHLKNFTPLQQAIARQNAYKAFKDKARRDIFYKNNQFSFLLCISPIEEVLKETLDGKPILIALVERGYAHIADLLIAKAPRGTLKKVLSENSPLSERFGEKIALKGYLDWFELLPNYSRRCLTIAADKNYTNWSIVEYILNHASEKEIDLGIYNDILTQASQENRTTLCARLINAGTLKALTPSLVDSEQCTPCHHAVYYNNEVLLKLLLQSDRDLLKINTNHQTPLHLALSIERTQCAVMIAQKQKGYEMLIPIILAAKNLTTYAEELSHYKAHQKAGEDIKRLTQELLINAHEYLAKPQKRAQNQDLINKHLTDISKLIPNEEHRLLKQWSRDCLNALINLAIALTGIGLLILLAKRHYVRLPTSGQQAEKNVIHSIGLFFKSETSRNNDARMNRPMFFQG